MKLIFIYPNAFADDMSAEKLQGIIDSGKTTVLSTVNPDVAKYITTIDVPSLKAEWDKPGVIIPFAQPTEYAKYILGFLILNAISTLILLLKSL